MQRVVGHPIYVDVKEWGVGRTTASNLELCHREEDREVSMNLPRDPCCPGRCLHFWAGRRGLPTRVASLRPQAWPAGPATRRRGKCHQKWNWNPMDDGRWCKQNRPEQPYHLAPSSKTENTYLSKTENTYLSKTKNTNLSKHPTPTGRKDAPQRRQSNKSRHPTFGMNYATSWAGAQISPANTKNDFVSLLDAMNARNSNSAMLANKRTPRRWTVAQGHFVRRRAIHAIPQFSRGEPSPAIPSQPNQTYRRLPRVQIKHHDAVGCEHVLSVKGGKWGLNAHQCRHRTVQDVHQC